MQLLMLAAVAAGCLEPREPQAGTQEVQPCTRD